MIKLVIGVVIAAMIVIAGFLVLDPKVNVGNSGGGFVSGSGNETTLKISVEGEVKKEGTYKLDEDATMYDLIQAAGGLTDNADERCFYEEATLEGGMTYYIPGMYDATDICNSSEITKVNVNSDPADVLMQVNGISASIASSIVSYRLNESSFRTIEDLMNVYGIGTATYKKIRPYVYLHE